MPQFKQYQQGDDKPTLKSYRILWAATSNSDQRPDANGDMLAINEEGKAT